MEYIFKELDISVVAEIEKKLEELQKQLLIRSNSKEDYNYITDEIYRLREEKHNALAEDVESEGVRQRIEDMRTFLNEQHSEIEEHDENLVRRLIQKVIVYEDKYNVEFKSGMKIDIEM